MASIQRIESYQVFDSRGRPTVETRITLDGGATGRGTVPSGASTGQYEALELRDQLPNRFGGRSVFRAIENVEREIAPRLLSRNAFDQAAIDQAMIELDGTPNKSRLGANAILSVSMAVAQAAAAARRLPLFESLRVDEPFSALDDWLLPLPEIQIFGGGAHADWRIDLQDFLIIPIGASTYSQALEICHDVYHAAGTLLREQGKSPAIADEGGYWPDFSSHDEVFQSLMRSIERAGYVAGRDVGLSLDLAASDLYHNDRYCLRLEGRSFTTAEFCDQLLRWCEQYPIVSLEDPLADTDWNGWSHLCQQLGPNVQLIGDDLFTTNLQRIELGIERQVANAVLIKLNQIGTVTETCAAIDRTQRAGWLPVISARSGETEDAFIAHLAVASNAGQLKVGSFARSERMAKWNEILRIQQHLGSRCRFDGAKIYRTRGTR